MRLVIQRVRRARVIIEGQTRGEISAGMVVLIAVGKSDQPETASELAEKTAHLRIFSDAEGKMNVSLLESGGAALVVSQFTLYGDVRRGHRPGFDRAAPPQEARRLYEEYVVALRSHGLRVETGEFQADMQVELVNDGPVTILIDSEKAF
jgi:D-aminoacyl-tRNA deacylase